MSVREDLIAAKALIADPKKWRQDPNIGADGSMCAVRAVERACGEEEYSWWHEGTRSWTACHLLILAIPDDLTGTFYNDRPDTTHADVMAWFDRAIAATTTTTPQPAD
jgi:hypothetical protein